MKYEQVRPTRISSASFEYSGQSSGASRPAPSSKPMTASSLTFTAAAAIFLVPVYVGSLSCPGLEALHIHLLMTGSWSYHKRASLLLTTCIACILNQPVSDIQFATIMLNAKARGYGYFSIDEERSDTKGPWIDVAVDQRERRLSFSLKFFSYFFRRPFSPAVLSLLFPPLSQTFSSCALAVTTLADKSGNPSQGAKERNG